MCIRDRIWATAAIGTILHIVWLRTPNWVFTTVYVVLGLAPVTLIPQLWTCLLYTSRCV